MSVYVRAALASFTWRRVLVTQAITQLLAILMALDWGLYGKHIGHTSIHFLTMSVYALLLLPLAYCADLAVTRSGRSWLVYAVVLIVLNPLLGMLVTGVMQAFYCAAFDLKWPSRGWGFSEAGGHMSVPCSLGLLVFMNDRAAKRLLEDLRSAQLRRVRLDQQLVESRLATAEAQIDPKKLLGALAQIKQGLQSDATDAQQQLNKLILTLRASLARTSAVTTEKQDS